MAWLAGLLGAFVLLALARPRPRVAAVAVGALVVSTMVLIARQANGI